MAYKDLEKKRAYSRLWRKNNRHKLIESERRYRASRPPKKPVAFDPAGLDEPMIHPMWIPKGTYQHMIGGEWCVRIHDKIEGWMYFSFTQLPTLYRYLQQNGKEFTLDTYGNH